MCAWVNSPQLSCLSLFVGAFLALNAEWVLTDVFISLQTLFVKFDKMFVLSVGGADWTEPV